MVLCERCKQKEAAVYVSEVLDGQKKEYYLCNECVNETQKQVDIETLLFSNFLSELMKIALKEEYAKTLQEEKPKQCSKCGLSLGEFMKSGKFGCENCYTTFDSEVKKALLNVHGNTKHRGKILDSIDKEEDLIQKLPMLEKALQEAIKGEDYEQAVRIRDEIRAIKGGRE